MLEQKKPSVIVRQAICLLQRVGWTRGALWRKSAGNEGEVGAFCALGALAAARMETTDYKKLVIHRRNVENRGNYPDRETEDLVEEAGMSTFDVFTANDSPWASKGRVIQMLDNMATELEAKGR